MPLQSSREVLIKTKVNILFFAGEPDHDCEAECGECGEPGVYDDETDASYEPNYSSIEPSYRGHEECSGEWDKEKKKCHCFTIEHE